MNRKLKIALLAFIVLFTILAAVFCALLIQNYREQFDMKMTHAEMTEHVRNASVALALFVVAGFVALWRLIHLLRSGASGRVGE
jgi:uncharacterized membrane protein YidH (DUF202 family)